VKTATDIPTGSRLRPGRRRLDRPGPNRRLNVHPTPVRGAGAGHAGPVRVLHVVSTFEVKTDTKWLIQLLGHLDRRRVASSIACMYGGGPMQERFASLGIETANWHAPAELGPSPLARAYRGIRDGRFDVVHTHLLRADLYAGLAARLAGAKAVVSTVYAIGPYRRSRRRRLDGLLDQLTRLWPTHLVAVSRAVKDDCVRRLRWADTRVSVIHTGIEADRYGPDASARDRIRSEWGIEPATPLIVTVARLGYEKGLATLVEASAALAKRHPTAVTAIVGDGPMRAELADKIATAGFSGRVRLMGFRADVPDVLRAADVFCLPSDMEGLPNAILEACAAGLPVVATAVGGVPELVVDGETGLLVAPGRPDALADAIGRLLDDAPLARRLADAGRQRVAATFDVDAVAERYQAMYEALVAGDV